MVERQHSELEVVRFNSCLPDLIIRNKQRVAQCRARAPTYERGVAG
jgi:hypothetical protein